MKTRLVIKDDLKPYIAESIDRSTESAYVAQWYAEHNIDPFAWQWLFKFDNDYGASVVKHWGSYGFEQDLFELAIIEWSEDDLNGFHLVYGTSINEDCVEGHLSNEEVMNYLYKIKDLKEGE